MSFLYAPPTPPSTLEDASGIALLAGVWTEAIALTPAPSKWIQLRISSAVAGEIEIGLGAAGAEVVILHWGYANATNRDVGNLAFQIPAGVRISLRSSTNSTAELHYYH